MQLQGKQQLPDHFFPGNMVRRLYSLLHALDYVMRSESKSGEKSSAPEDDHIYSAHEDEDTSSAPEDEDTSSPEDEGTPSSEDDSIPTDDEEY